MSLVVRERLLALLQERGADYRLIEHQAARSAPDVTALLNIQPHQGAKAILLRVEGVVQPYVLAVLPGDSRIDHKQLRHLLASRNVKLADPDSVQQVTDCEIGSVPPFGELFSIPTYVDEDLFNNEQVGFSPAVLDASVLMPAQEFRRVLRATVVRLSKRD